MSANLSESKVDADRFRLHLGILQKKLKDKSIFKETTGVAFITGNNDVFTYNKSSAIQSANFFSPLESTLGVVLKIRRSDSQTNTSEQFIEALQSVDFNPNDTALTLGIFEKDKFSGPFATSWYDYLGESHFKKMDVSLPVAVVLSTKDTQEIINFKKASAVCTTMYTGFVKPKILDVIDDDKIVKHSKIANDIEDAFEDRSFYQPDMATEEVESPFPPIIQSGGDYALKFSTSSDNRNLKFDCVVILFGVRYKHYCTSLARTLMIKPSDLLKSLYSFLLELFDILIKSLIVGAKFCDIFNIVYVKVRAVYPQYAEYFVKNIGFVTGLEFRESSMVFDSKNQTIVQPGMIFIFLLGFQNFNVHGSNNSSCVAVGDTVGVNLDGSVVVYTDSKRSLASSTVILSDAAKKEQSTNGVAITTAKKRQPLQDALLNEENRRAHQAELKIKLNEEARKRLLQNEESKSEKSIVPKSFDGSYKNPASIPCDPDVLNLRLYVDKIAETIVVPLFGMGVPFHISTIKSVTSSVEGGYTYLRINLHTIIGPASKVEDLSVTYGKNVYVKEMIFRGHSQRADTSLERPFNITHIFNQIKDLQKNYKARLQHENEMQGVVRQADLIINPTKNVPRLKDIQIRPQLGTRKASGTLEAHTNGFRFVSIKGEKLDILYDNLKHAIFQPCDRETSIIIHFHLKSPIMIGKKKYEDVQFYNDVGEAVSDIGKMSSSMLERDEIESEQREREMRNNLKQIYKCFIERVESVTHSIEFEIPMRELGFDGVPYKASCFLMPTPKCLINIVEQPPFVVSIADIELAHFERVSFGMKNFDLVLIFKDYRRKSSMISSIDMSNLESIKDWLNSCDIKYTESKQNLNWTKIMKTILDDPEDFFATGGWGFLDPDTDEGDDHQHESSEQDEEYKPQSSEEFAVESLSGSDEDYVSENSESDYPIDEDSDTGKSWTDLENEARMEDALRYGSRYSPPEKRKFQPKGFIDKRPKM